MPEGANSMETIKNVGENVVAIVKTPPIAHLRYKRTSRGFAAKQLLTTLWQERLR